VRINIVINEEGVRMNKNNEGRRCEDERKDEYKDE